MSFFSPIYDFYIVIFRFRAIPGLMEPQLWFLRPVRLKLGFFFFFVVGRGIKQTMLNVIIELLHGNGWNRAPLRNSQQFFYCLPELMEMSHTK